MSTLRELRLRSARSNESGGRKKSLVSHGNLANGRCGQVGSGATARGEKTNSEAQSVVPEELEEAQRVREQPTRKMQDDMNNSSEQERIIAGESHDGMDGTSQPSPEDSSSPANVETKSSKTRCPTQELTCHNPTTLMVEPGRRYLDVAGTATIKHHLEDLAALPRESSSPESNLLEPLEMCSTETACSCPRAEVVDKRWMSPSEDNVELRGAVHDALKKLQIGNAPANPSCPSCRSFQEEITSLKEIMAMDVRALKQHQQKIEKLQQKNKVHVEKLKSQQEEIECLQERMKAIQEARQNDFSQLQQQIETCNALMKRLYAQE